MAVFLDPFDEISKMHREMERIFSHFYGKGAAMLPGRAEKEGKEIARVPVAGIKETDTEVTATFEIPGALKENIDLNVTENSIEVKAEQKHEKEEKSRDYYGYAAVSRSFYRKLPLPVEVKADEAFANYENGVLKVTMPKAGGAPKKRIEIK